MEKTYYEERLPDLIEKLKSQVKKNLDVINREVESEIGEDKYFNVLRGRRDAAENCIDTMTKISELEFEITKNTEGTYYTEMLPVLIERLKEMVDINLEVVDIEIDEEDEEDLRSLIGPEIKEIFGADIAKKIFKKLGPGDKLTEDKYHAVLKARKTASEDTQWVLKKIDMLENKLYDRVAKDDKRKGWDIYSAENNK